MSAAQQVCDASNADGHAAQRAQPIVAAAAEQINTKTNLNNVNMLPLKTAGTGKPKQRRGRPWPKGVSGNPGGRPKQIFFGTKPFRVALMRELQDRSIGDDELQRIAARLVDEALTGTFPMAAIKEIGNRLDGAPEREPAPPQQNGVQAVIDALRVLNLSKEQRDACKEYLERSS